MLKGDNLCGDDNGMCTHYCFPLPAYDSTSKSTKTGCMCPDFFIFGFIPSKPLNHLAFQYFDIERTWGRLFQKRVMSTKFDIYDFIIGFIPLTKDEYIWTFMCPDFFILKADNKTCTEIGTCLRQRNYISKVTPV
jgi:hypothetical protein